ncbi:MAG: succinate dehydrogenase cytochrome b subunit [Nannocystaceae bacterium]|nr:succinate dehydrogenase cytochrome b subunit [Nannocystaceae bacterium]
MTTDILRTTIAAKVTMALSGAGLVLFALAHMAGHLQVFGGREVYNHYAETLQGLGAIKWAVRAGLLGILLVHVRAGVLLSQRNRAARPQAYALRRLQRTTTHGRAMLLTGVAFLAFILYHLAHFTLGWVHPQFFHAVDSLGRPDVYGNFVRSFQHPLITITYLGASLAVAMHATHATSSLLRTLGLSHGRFRRACEAAGPVVGVALLAGFACVPLACLLRLIQP